MNTRVLLLAGWLASTLVVAQSQNPDTDEVIDPTAAAIGPDHQQLEVVKSWEDPSGRILSKTNIIIQLELGLNYLDKEGNWKPTQERFVEENGWATAREGQHYVALYNNLNAEGSVLLEQPDGRRFRSTIQGLALTDAESGQSILIAEIQNCQGMFWTDNQIVYPNAFFGVAADIRYTYHKWGFEQDVILREALPAPQVLGLNPATTRLEVWTEFFEGGDPVTERTILNSEEMAASGAPPLVDEALDFGAMRIGLGRAFKLDKESDTLSFVAKEWVRTDDGRRFLVETVALDTMSAGLDALPPAAGGAKRTSAPINRLEALRGLPSKPSPKEVGTAAKWLRPNSEVLVAQLNRPGVIIDYTTINYTTNDMRFRGDQTYYVSGLVTCNGTTTFEGGAVIKYTNTTSARIEIGGATVWPTDNTYRPIIFTAKDDNTVWETVTGSTGSPSGFYADSALKWASATIAIDARNLRFVRAKSGITLNGGSGHKFRHVQFVDCESAMKPTSTDFGLHNSLFTGVTFVFNGSSATGRLEHATVNGATAFNYNSTFASGNLRVTNSVIAAVTTLGTLTATNKVAVLSSASGVFATQAAGGAHYLASGSPYRDLGVAVSSELSTDLPKMTTYAPSVISATITSAAEFSPVNSRDTNTLDLGYHYAPIDYIFSANPGVVVTNATVTLKNGVVVSHDQLAPLILTGTSTLNSVGLPHRMNVMTYYTTVQERKSASHYAGTTKYAFYAIGAYNSGTRAASMAFTCVEGATVPTYYCLYWGDGFTMQSMLYRDCQFTFADADLTSSAPSSYLVSLVNNLWVRPTYNSFGLLPHFLANQTVSGGAFSLYGAAVDWRDSLLHTTSIDLDSGGSGGVTNRNNLFVSLTAFSSNGSNVSCITNSPFNFASGTLGPWYHSSTTGINNGSRTAGAASLYHHTVKTDNSKDGATTVDIGFHYVSTSSGLPIDTDSDGVPDYVEDANGDGGLNSGETSITSNTDLGLSVLITEPKSGQNLP